MACLQPLPLIFSMAYHTACLFQPPYRGFFQHLLSLPSCDWYPVCHHQGNLSALAFFCYFLHHWITKHGLVWCRASQTSCSGTVCASNIFNVPGPGHSEIRYFTFVMTNFPSKFLRHEISFQINSPSCRSSSFCSYTQLILCIHVTSIYTLCTYRKKNP